MIHSVTGTVLETPINRIILDNGHNCSLSIFALDCDRVLGYSGRFYVHFYLRQDHMSLFGFQNEELCLVFKELITVKGCGPKTALNILNHISLNALTKAIYERDEKVLMKLPGIGKRMAAQLILDLQNKFENHIEVQTSVLDIGGVIKALIDLGYSKGLCERILNEVDISLIDSEEKLIKVMISKLSSKGTRL